MKSTTKKRLIISYKNLSEAEKQAFDERYEDGYSEFIQKIQKPDGSLLFVVPFETDVAMYMVKVDVRVDTKLTDEEFDKEVLHSDKEEEDELDDTTADPDKADKANFVLVHGDYSDVEKEVEKEAAKDMPDDDSFDDDYIDDKKQTDDEDDDYTR
jgi:hypothetical protein